MGALCLSWLAINLPFTPTWYIVTEGVYFKPDLTWNNRFTLVLYPSWGLLNCNNYVSRSVTGVSDRKNICITKRKTVFVFIFFIISSSPEIFGYYMTSAWRKHLFSLPTQFHLLYQLEFCIFIFLCYILYNVFPTILLLITHGHNFRIVAIIIIIFGSYFLNKGLILIFY